VEIRYLTLNEEPAQTLATATPPPAEDLFAIIEATYGEPYDGQYLMWEEAWQVFMVHGFAGEEVSFEPLPIKTRQGEVLGTALATVRLLNLHQGNQNSILVPLAIELSNEALFIPGVDELLWGQDKLGYLVHLREENFIGRSISVLTAPDAGTAWEAMNMPDMPWQIELITTYQNSWKTEMDKMLATGQAVSVNGQDLLLIPVEIWYDFLDPLELP
jgi:hypothetical protein